MVDNAIKFVSDKSSSIEPELKKHKINDAVTVDKKHNNNDIQRSKEEDKQQLQFYPLISLCYRIMQLA